MFFLEAVSAVEQDDINNLNNITSNHVFDINQPLNCGFYREFGFQLNLLDVALMLGHYKIANLLLDKGSTIQKDIDIESRKKYVTNVKHMLETKIKFISDRSHDKKDGDQKQINHIYDQLKIVKQMEKILDRKESTGYVIDARVYVSSSTTVLLEFFTPPNSLNNVIVKYKVEWSSTPDFEKIIGFKMVYDIRQTCIEIENLVHGERYCFRIIAGSIFGNGIPVQANPCPITISSWEDVDDVAIKDENDCHQEVMNVLAKNVEKFKNSIIWQRIFPANSEGNVKKKPLLIRHLFSASKRFVKHVQKGIYLASMIYTTDKVLCTVDDTLPVMSIEENNQSNLSTDDMRWLMKLSYCWKQIKYFQDVANVNSTNFQFRASIIESINSMMNALGVKDIGTVHYKPIIFEKDEAIFIVTVRYTFEDQITQGLAMKWISLSKLLKKKTSCQALDFLNSESIKILNFFESFQIPLDRGLYLGYLKTFSTLNSIDVIVPENLPSSLPFVCIRDNPHVSKEEWEWIQTLNDYGPIDNINGNRNSQRFSSSEEDNLEETEEDDDSKINVIPTYVQKRFQEKISRSIQIFLNDLGISASNMMNHRIYRLQIFRLHPDISMILIVPNIDEVCTMVTEKNLQNKYTKSLATNCQILPVPVFELLHLSTYQPEFISHFCQLSIFIEHFISITQYEYRKSIIDSDEKVYKELYEKLNDFKMQLEKIWKNARWISNITKTARDINKNYQFVEISKTVIKKNCGSINSYNSLEEKHYIEECNYYDYKKNLKHSKFYGSRNDFNESPNKLLRNISTEDKKQSFKTKNNAIFNFDKLFINGKKSNDSKSPIFRQCMAARANALSNEAKASNIDDSLLRFRSASQGSSFLRFGSKSPKNKRLSSRKARFTRNETTSVLNDHDSSNSIEINSDQLTEYGLLRVNVAFDYYDNFGTSIRLRVTKSTTCKEVIHLIIKQLNHVKSKLSPDLSSSHSIIDKKFNEKEILYDEENFCLVAVVGARERRLRNEFQPLNLNPPWNRGKLYIRNVDEPSEAIICGNEVLV
uniref:ANK_REP_REGION domain-containing protein n=1 Tax=Parastrongyloides trichosuri TaxID=131310 RepID=A0A0N5A483_PARTI